MKFTYKVGDPVCYRKETDKKGTVEELFDEEGDEFRVNWNDIGSRWCEARDILPDTPEALQQLADNNKNTQSKIDEATNLLEQAFKAWFEAVSLQTGSEAGHDDAYYLKQNPDLDVSEFERVVDINGWSTSSLYC
jgi:hypothetical protein